MRLIPTARKEKLPRGFSYPLGAERISELLDGVPQVESMALSFSWRDAFRNSHWRRRVIDRGVVTLLDVSFSRYFGGWNVRVYSVPSEDVTAARERLEVELERVRQQLMAPRPASQVRVTLDLAAVGPASKAVANRRSAIRLDAR